MKNKNDKIRIIAALILSFAVFAVWQMIFPPVAPVKEQQTQTQQAAGTSPQTSVTAATTSSTPATATEPFVYKNDQVEIAFDPNSGDVRYVNMSKYELGDTKIVFKDTFKNTNYASLTAGISSGFTHSVANTEDGAVIIFRAENSQIVVTKTYKITNDSYGIPLTLAVQNKTDNALSVLVEAKVGPGLGEGFDSGKYVYTGPIIGDKKKIEKKLKKTPVLENALWGGNTSKYFLVAFLGNFEKGALVKYNNDFGYAELTRNITVNPNGETIVDDMTLYAGPKNYDALKSYDIGVQKTIEYGMFSLLAIPMTKILNAAYGIVRNYGIAIIILTIIVKLLTLPLTLKSTLSMRAMTKLQPEIAKLKEKYKDDAQKLNAATMKLYSENKVNPMSGCLPLFIQLPVFIALYRTLLVSLELKSAPFFGWIVDLSASDPYLITPILMGVSMFVSQKMTPSTATDPMQQKMFLMMPVVFTFLFLKMPSGLVLYWLTNNILTIVQQLIINKKFK